MIKYIKNQLYIREMTIVFLYLFLLYLIPGFGFFIVAHLFYLSLFKRNEWYLKSIAYFVLLKSLNPIFHPPPSNFYIAFIFILFGIFFIKFILTGRQQILPLEKKLFILLGLFAITSFIGSYYVDFSLIRILFLFMMIYVIFESVIIVSQKILINFLITLTIIIIYASFPLLFTPKGYLMPMGFFKGIFNHSQDFGLLLLPLFVLYTILVISGYFQKKFFHYITILLGFIELVSSGSRSAVFAIIGSLVVYFILKTDIKLTIRKIIVGLFSILFIILAFIVSGNKIMDKIHSFVVKYDSGNSRSIDETITGRIILVEIAKQNLFSHPFTGVGFNVQTWYQDPVLQATWKTKTKYISGTNIMYSRPLEKGNLYASVFEEGGFIVGIYFLYILIYLFIILYGYKPDSYLWVPYLAMLINFNGEASLLSPMGPGNFQILLLASFYAIAYKNTQKRSKHEI